MHILFQITMYLFPIQNQISVEPMRVSLVDVDLYNGFIITSKTASILSYKIGKSMNIGHSF